MKKVVFLLAMMVGVSSYAQSLESLKAEKAKKEKEIKKLQGEVKALDVKMDTRPGWKFGGMGTIGANFSGFNKWYSNAMPNSSTGSIGIVLNGFANLDTPKYFWRNTGTLNLGWTKLDNKDVATDSDKFEATTDVFKITSLYGYKLTETLAASVMAEYRTTFINNFNNPGYLDLGAGLTWTPIQEFVMVVHPLNYNFVFSKSGSNYDSSLGAKIMAEYNREFNGFKYRSNLTAFLSYSDVKELSNWTWTNSLAFNLWKGIGVGLEAGLRQNKQEAKNLGGATDNPLQSYWLLGLSYSL
ncbi:MAG: DUF3078 domain-containing protein [Flavobacteriaceae bacterium]|nr:DUF3078 domain-containing protein [Flavobacteriaceae bacterium]